MSSSQDSGLMSSAGLVRYFDEDSSTVKINPKTLLAFSVLIGLVVQVLTAF